jgi:hypothetical protein
MLVGKNEAMNQKWFVVMFKGYMESTNWFWGLDIQESKS